ncbi:MAG TPA: DEAD/DEAH box helicase family protein [Candidatus Kapabacteria bacterium]|nr:DEAD/DEAH box helicase family protein [Candidatus Kapabacteria bacterium]
MVRLIRKDFFVFCIFESISERKITKDSLSFSMPGYEYSKKFIDGYWDGKIKYFNSKNNSFPIGLLSYVVKSYEKNNISYEIVGFEPKDVSWVEFSALFKSDQRRFQRDAMLEHLKKGYGVIIIPTRGGKTYVAGELIRLLHNKTGCKSLFITDITDAFNQAIQDISKVLNISKDQIGIIKGEKISIRNINVAMVQTLQSIMKVSNRNKHKDRYEKIKKLFSENIYLIVDEVHEYGNSKSRMNLISSIKSKQAILGLSATPYKKDKIQNLNIKKLFGGEVYEISEKSLVEEKVLALNKILLIEIENSENSGKYSEIIEKLIIKNKERNQIILDIIEICKDLSLKLLIMFNSKKHGRFIANLSGEQFISGDDTGNIREETKRKFLNNKGMVLLVSHIWKKGITLPEVQVLLNASGGKEQSLVVQIRGRVLGVSENKNRAMFIDFIDSGNNYLSEHSLQRIKAYEGKLDEKNIEVLNSNDSNFYNDLRTLIKEFLYE